MKPPSLFEYLPLEDAQLLWKHASREAGELRPVVAGTLGFGAGTIAGAAAGHFANKAVKHFTGKSIPTSVLLAAAPVLGGGLGLAYNLAQAHQAREIRRASESTDDQSSRRVS